MGDAYDDVKEALLAPFVDRTEEKTREEFDSVTGPAHYLQGRLYEPIDVIEDWELGFCLGQVVKYVSRTDRKDDALQDLRKAQFYLDREIISREMKADRESS